MMCHAVNLLTKHPIFAIMIKFDIYPHTLCFKQPAGTSRGVYTTRQVWYVVARDGNRVGIGECAPLPDLSCDRGPSYERYLRRLCDFVEQADGVIDYEAFRPFPSMLFGIETALRHLESGSFCLWHSQFTDEGLDIPINGLIWMGSYDEMFARIEEKRQKGYRCVKLKIGAIDFDREIDLIRHIRSSFSRSDIELRVDANGAFAVDDAMNRLEQLAKYDIHSIEQPIRAGQWEDMARLCASTPLPIALDEELIGVNTPDMKHRMLDFIKPQYIILKPSLHGGLFGSEEWISFANQMNIRWWATSALESNIGLNAIAQWCATKHPSMPQGLGTGQLFTDNFSMPLSIVGDAMHIDTSSMPSPDDFLQWISK